MEVDPEDFIVNHSVSGGIWVQMIVFMGNIKNKVNMSSMVKLWLKLGFTGERGCPWAQETEAHHIGLFNALYLPLLCRKRIS